MEKFKLTQDASGHYKADFKKAAQSSTSREFNYELWKQLQDELCPDKSGRFLATSIFIHGLFVLIAFAASLQMFEDKKTRAASPATRRSGPWPG